nr:MAG: hypothetical protein EDM05_18795 [Leptolyngbya sp. IPPAS B-1204]
MVMGIYKNVMELLVEEEVVRQFNSLSPRVAAYVNQIEWVAHALNQLPPLYATSEKGLHYQIQCGRLKHGAAIKQAVQRALAAIRRDPLRSSTPLESPNVPLPEILTQLRFLLHNDYLEWEALPYAVEQALEQASQGQLTPPPSFRSPSVYSPLRSSSPFPDYQSNRPTNPSERAASPPLNPSHLRQSQTEPDQRSSHQHEVYGWDDPLYNSR